MNGLKHKNFERAVGHPAARGIGLVMGLMPEHLVAEFSGRQLGEVARLLEATYQDGWSAAGGGVGTVLHCEDHRRHVLTEIAR